MSPEDFYFKLNSSELAEIKSQIAIWSDITIEKALPHQPLLSILKNENLMMELKNNDHLSKTFSHFEKHIEQNLIVLYKNNSSNQKKFKDFEKRLSIIEAQLRKK